MVAGIKWVNDAVYQDGYNATSNLAFHEPDVFVLGEDQEPFMKYKLPKGCALYVLDRTDGISTTDIVKRIKCS